MFCSKCFRSKIVIPPFQNTLILKMYSGSARLLPPFYSRGEYRGGSFRNSDIYGLQSVTQETCPVIRICHDFFY